MAVFGVYKRKNYKNVRPALYTEYECSTQQLVVKASVIPSDIQFRVLGNSTPYMLLSFIVFVLLTWRSLITWRAAHLFRSVIVSTSYVIRTFLNRTTRDSVIMSFTAICQASTSQKLHAAVNSCTSMRLLKLVKKIPILLENDGSLQCSSKPAICTYPEPQ